MVQSNGTWNADIRKGKYGVDLIVKIGGYEYRITGTEYGGYTIWSAKDTLVSLTTRKRKTLTREQWKKFIDKNNSKTKNK